MKKIILMIAMGLLLGSFVLAGGNDEFTILLVHSDHQDGSTNIEDASETAINIYGTGDARHSTTKSKFGQSSLTASALNANSIQIRYVSGVNVLGADDFTIDFWINTLASNFAEIIYSGGGDDYWGITFSNGLVRFRSYIAGSEHTTEFNLPPGVNDGNWHHVAFVRASSVLKAYIDGIEERSDIFDYSLTSSNEYITLLRYHAAYLDEVRISKGIARTEDSNDLMYDPEGDGFTPPNIPYSAAAASNEPTYTNFTSTETTNFSAVDVTNVTNLTLAKTGKGKIQFAEDHGINSDGEDYDAHIKIEDKVIFVNSSALHSSFNDSATLTFYNVDCNKPYVFYSKTASTFASILSENQRCPESLCTNIQCEGSTLTVDVAHFTGFAAGADANLTIEAEAGIKYALDSIEFTAEYINSTDGTPISGECNITFDDEGTWYTMDFNSPDYNYTKSFAAAGTHEYNVTCSSANFVTLEANDTKIVSPTDIPEFSTITLGLGLIAVLGGLFIIRKKK
ncbi:MAG: LamG domain-containing protein [Nanoarchaeota archaeon]|nr:LamG domain-containing protein [Nanoarchaeota archaeon]